MREHVFFFLMYGLLVLFEVKELVLHRSGGKTGTRSSTLVLLTIRSRPVLSSVLSSFHEKLHPFLLHYFRGAGPWDLGSTRYCLSSAKRVPHCQQRREMLARGNGRYPGLEVFEKTHNGFGLEGYQMRLGVHACQKRARFYRGCFAFRNRSMEESWGRERRKELFVRLRSTIAWIGMTLHLILLIEWNIIIRVVFHWERKPLCSDCVAPESPYILMRN